MKGFERACDMSRINVLDFVALNEELPERGLQRGQVGTVVDTVATNVYEVEFSDDDGLTFASLALRGDLLLVLHYQPVKVT